MGSRDSTCLDRVCTWHAAFGAASSFLATPLCWMILTRAIPPLSSSLSVTAHPPGLRHFRRQRQDPEGLLPS